MRVPTLSLLLLLQLSWSCSEPEVLPVSGVLITMDTTNPGALDIYGESRGLTPALDALAAQSLVFDRAFSVAPLTLPSHISMMTGLYPLRHGVRDNGWARLSESAQTLAEGAQEAGYQTAAFVSAVVLTAAYGLDQGFEHYEEPEQKPGKALAMIHEQSSSAVTDAALAWFAARDTERPFFLWVHYFDPHMPHLPPAEFVERAAGNLYHAEVAAMDHDIGRLMQALDRAVPRDKLFVACAADHGESFGRHGEPSHSAFVYQSTMHVPLLLRFPDGHGAGLRSDDTVSLVDLYPTFLAELALAAAPGVDGLALGRAALSESRGVYMESYAGYLNYGWSPLAAWADRDGKYLHSSNPEFFDLRVDPGEARNLLPEGERDVTRYRSGIESLTRKPVLAADDSLQLDEEALAELRALGYAASGDTFAELPAPLEPSERPAPVDCAPQYARFAKAIGMAQAGRNKGAIKLLREIIEQNPGNIYAVETLGGCYLEEQRFEETVLTLGGLVQRGVERYTTSAFLATALENLGRNAEALVHYEAAKRLRPTEPTIDTALARVRRKLGQ